MKLIILAAGTGSRLKDLTKNNHKSLLSLNHKETILGRLLNQFSKFGIKKIIIIAGHKSKLIKKNFQNVANIKYYKNYKKTNNLHTLLAFKHLLKDDDIIIAFSDLVVKNSIIKKIIKKKIDNYLLAVDKTRVVSGTMKVQLSRQRLLKIGKINKKIAHGNFIGISKISKVSLKTFKTQLETLAKASKKNYYTEVFNSLVKLGIKINVINIGDKWVEVDNRKDYSKAKKFVNYYNYI